MVLAYKLLLIAPACIFNNIITSSKQQKCSVISSHSAAVYSTWSGPAAGAEMTYPSDHRTCAAWITSSVDVRVNAIYSTAINSLKHSVAQRSSAQKQYLQYTKYVYNTTYVRG
jgi:uncharacterized protein YecT (DUF1311 family)